jgi:hypothetical protein
MRKSHLLLGLAGLALLGACWFVWPSARSRESYRTGDLLITEKHERTARLLPIAEWGFGSTSNLAGHGGYSWTEHSVERTRYGLVEVEDCTTRYLKWSPQG